MSMTTVSMEMSQCASKGKFRFFQSAAEPAAQPAAQPNAKPAAQPAELRAGGLEREDPEGLLDLDTELFDPKEEDLRRGLSKMHTMMQ